MIVSISQPTLFPWLGYFNIIKSSDVFVFFNNVKFEKRSWQMRNRIKSVAKNEEKEIWVRIPTKEVSSETRIMDVKIDNEQDWKTKHCNAFLSNYGKDWKEISFLANIYKKDWEKIVDFNMNFIIDCCKYLNIKTKFLQASELNVDGKKSELLLNICKKLNATEYVTSVGARVYLEKDKEIFKKNNIKISYHDYSHPVYKQKGKIFVKNLSVLDLLFNEKQESYKFI